MKEDYPSVPFFFPPPLAINLTEIINLTESCTNILKIHSHHTNKFTFLFTHRFFSTYIFYVNFLYIFVSVPTRVR